MTLRVLVAGAGLGGLCLAQGLRAAGVAVHVCERDPSADTRGQGYRLRMDQNGIDALGRCLPADLMELFHATTNAPQPPRGVVFDHRLRQVEALGDALSASERQRRSTVANRTTLRQILLTGLDGVVEFGAEVVRLGESADGVVAELADGRRLSGDVLIGADGAASVTRAHLLPQARLRDTGLRGIYGRAILDRDLLAVLPEALLAGSPRVVGPDGLNLAIGSYRPVEEPHRASTRIAPRANLSPVADYVKWSLVAAPESFGLDEQQVWAADPSTLYETACRLTADWHPALAALIRRADPRSVFAVPLRAALPVEAWPPGRITLLGDAIHATTPAGGTGANVALRDAALLTDQLTAVHRGVSGLVDAVAGYEEQMREYGFAAATRSLQGAELIFRRRMSALV